MGALHAGHASLVRRGVAEARGRGFSSGCVVSVFVNPTQFNEQGDFTRYPRTLEADAALCARAGASFVFAPSAAEVYPPHREIRVPALPDVATRPGLEDAMRPGHFAGVCQVVKRLFEMARPGAAVFGEKDWQQLAVIRAMAERLSLPVDILACETVREEDGLAMSSRNRFLAARERERAAAIHAALAAAREESAPAEAEGRMRGVLKHAGLEVEYAVVRDAATLVGVGGGPARALIAARLGSVRLIDNAAWEPKKGLK
jgi:pantoate--beta-alanine ligase